MDRQRASKKGKIGEKREKRIFKKRKKKLEVVPKTATHKGMQEEREVRLKSKRGWSFVMTGHRLTRFQC